MAATAPVIDVIIPAYNEENSIALVVKELPTERLREVIVCNNNSRDNTAAVARKAGATVVDEPRAGYGSACLRGMAHIASRPEAEWPDIVVFIDGDHSDYPEELPELVAPIVTGKADLVIGSRALGNL
ncbi:MAG: glycosyltransferase family 2 protein, partial [Bacteroidota bacterium]